MKILERNFLKKSTRSVHASCVEFWNGYPVFSWFGGSKEGAQDVSIYVSNLHNEGKIIAIGNGDKIPRWNPILFNHNDKLWLFEKAGIFCDRWQTFIHDMTDYKEGITEDDLMKKTQIIPAGLNGPVKTRPIIVGEDIICGSSVETFCDWASYMESYRINTDNGKWDFVKRSNPIFPKSKESYDFYGNTRTSLGLIQPALWQDDDGQIHSFFRSSRGHNNIFYSKLMNNGLWDAPVATNLPNPNSSVDVVFLDGRLFLVYNPDSNYRMPLNIAELAKRSDSKWEIVNEITVTNSINDTENNEQTFTDELSYPYMIGHDGRLHLTYTFGRTRIEYCVISV